MGFIPCNDIRPYDDIRNTVDPATVWLFPEHYFMPLIALNAGNEAELVTAIQNYNEQVRRNGEPYPAAPTLMGFYLTTKPTRLLAINDACRDQAALKYVSYVMGVQLPRVVTLLNNLINANYTYDTVFTGGYRFFTEFRYSETYTFKNIGSFEYNLAGQVGSSFLSDGYYSTDIYAVGESLGIPLIRADKFTGTVDTPTVVTGGSPASGSNGSENQVVVTFTQSDLPPNIVFPQDNYTIPVAELLLDYTGKFAGLIGGLGALPNEYTSMPVFDLLTNAWGNCSVVTRLFFDSLPINTFGDTLTKFATVNRMSNTAQLTGLYHTDASGNVAEFTGDGARGRLTVARLAPTVERNTVLSSIRLDSEGYNATTVAVNSSLDGNNLTEALPFSKANTLFTGRSAGLWHTVTVEGNFILRGMYVTYSSGGLR